jgi:hypothetical protein
MIVVVVGDVFLHSGDSWAVLLLLVVCCVALMLASVLGGGAPVLLGLEPPVLGAELPL